MYRVLVIRGKSLKDTINLREDACFSTQIYPGVYWVPVNTLGKSQLTNEEIKKLISASPEIKRNRIQTLYELIQFIQIGGFEVVDDNMYEWHDGLMWEKHVTGYEAAKANKGCCASIANFGNYILKGKYDEVGLIGISSLSGNGHIVNYIIHKNHLFVIDLFTMTNKFVHEICVETGFKRDYVKTAIPTSILMMVDGFENFAKFFSKFMYLRSEEYLFFRHSGLDCPSVAVKNYGEKKIIILPKNEATQRIKFLKNDGHMDLRWMTFNEEDENV